MGLSDAIWHTPEEYIRIHAPEAPVLFFAPAVLQATARRYIAGFPGLVTFAVKSNPEEGVIANLHAAGVDGYDVASVPEIELIARVAPGAAMHYNNPVRSRAEIARAVEMGVRSFSVDSATELEKLRALVPAGAEVSVRFKLPVTGAAYDFGAKFGATVDDAAILLRQSADMGFTPSLTFHPGTQCTDAMAWDAYIRAAAGIAVSAGVRVARLNVGGGFPAHRLFDLNPAIEPIFALIDRVTDEAFGDQRPALVCEPGRGLVAESMSLCTRVRAVRDGRHVFLNDGVYGGLAELPLIGIIDRIDVRDGDGALRTGAPLPRVVFGPTCDSVDRLPGELALPGDIAEGDHVVFHGLGAYSTATVTRFNGFGTLDIATVQALA
jgi:ornithine decarboxylase